MMFHLHSDYLPGDEGTRRRMLVARKSWALQTTWQEQPIVGTQLRRSLVEGEQSLPYIGDLFALGCVGKGPDDIIVFTNADICIRAGGAQQMMRHLELRDAMYAFRKDFYHPFSEPMADAEIARGTDYPGADLFAFRVRWWLTHRAAYPDMLLGREAWDCCLRILMENTTPKKPLAIPNLIYHERHANGWENPAHRYKLAGQLHNLRLAWSWITRSGYQPQNFGVKRV